MDDDGLISASIFPSKVEYEVRGEEMTV